MNYPKIRYYDLERIILSLNFRELSTQGNQKLFEHPSGALIILPSYSENQLVSQTHLAAISRSSDCQIYAIFHHILMLIKKKNH